MARTALLIINAAKPDAVAAAPLVRAMIERADGRVASEMPAESTPVSSDQLRGVDLAVVLGGDGTLLSQSRRFLSHGLPLLGVNLGKLGYMAEFDLDALRQHAAAVFGEAPLDVLDRPLLAIEAARGHRAYATGVALNDAVVTAGPPYRMIALSVSIDGQPGPRIEGDGLIVSTPIGSTAYNVSAGGPIVAPDVPAMVVTPIAAHSLSFRPVVVSLDSVVEIAIDRANRVDAWGTTLVLDGQAAAQLHDGDVVRIRRNGTSAKFVRNPGGSYWSTLINKMRWAAPPVPRSR